MMEDIDGLQIYVAATKLAQKNNQTTGEKGDYYITLEQLEAILRKMVGKD